MLVIDGVQIVINGVYERELRNDILEKCEFLLTLIKGTIPMNRDIGIDPGIVSQPLYIAQQMYTMSAIETIEKYETRAIVEEVQFETTAGAGNMIPKVRLIYNGE
ncbi:MAG: hypothetical protein K1W36_00135 [Lachnospiraceae bacterium]